MAIKQQLQRVFATVAPRTYKRRTELKYWTEQFDQQAGQFSNSHYESFYTKTYDLTLQDYDGKTILDIGCGPRGSLEWATMTARRIGLDPLVPAYKKFGIDNHQMEYVASRSENIPFADQYFDLVTCINALDHVDDLNQTIDEIKRVTRIGGFFLLCVEIDHPPTATEPIVIDSLALNELLWPEFQEITSFVVGVPLLGHMLHNAVMAREPAYINGEPGVLVGKYVRAHT